MFGDGKEITLDPTHANGYDYTDATKTSIEVHGPLCEEIMSGEIKDGDRHVPLPRHLIAVDGALVSVE